MHNYSTELDFARQVAELGGSIALEHYRRDPQARRKPDGTWVTEADWTAEAQIRLRIARTFPYHNVLGEEEGLSAAGGGEPVDGAPTWVIDPIDGTNNFIAGIPIWATLVSLRVDDEAVVGVAHAPALSETYDAAAGLGARCNGLTIDVDPIDNLADAFVIFGGDRYFEEIGAPELPGRIAARVRRTRGFGDFWGHLLVARGAAHAMLDPMLSLWDYSALEPIVREAGGRMTQLNGKLLAGEGSCLTTNGALHAELVELATASGVR